MSNPDENQVKGMTLWIIWGGMFGSLVIYGLVLSIVSPESAKDPSTIRIMAMSMGGMSLAMIGGMFFLRKTMFFGPLEDGAFDDRQGVRQKYFTVSIITWALSEAIAIYGLVLSFLSGQLVFYGAFAAVGATLMVRFRPQLADILDQFGDPDADSSGARAADATVAVDEHGDASAEADDDAFAEADDTEW